MNGILIIAHAPLASALRACALHVFPDCADAVVAVDVAPNDAPEVSLAQALEALKTLQAQHVLVLTDVFGATPCNVAQRLKSGQTLRVLAGANVPMLLRSVSYRHEPMEHMLAKAQMGAVQGVVPVGTNPPQNQTGAPPHATDERHHQQ